MISSILTIVASIAGVIGSWAIFKFWLRPLLQRYQNWKDAHADQSAKEAANQENQRNNDQAQKDREARERIWDELSKP